MAAPNAFSWNSELPSGRNPYWIRDEALAGLGLHIGDAVSVDTGADPQDGDVVVAEAEIDGDSQRLARRYSSVAGMIRLESVSDTPESIELDENAVIVMGVVRGRVRFEEDGRRVIEEPLGLG